MAKAAAWTVFVLFALINVLISPLWAIVVLFGCAIKAFDWQDSFRIWCGLSTGNYAVPWWDWACGVKR